MPAPLGDLVRLLGQSGLANTTLNQLYPAPFPIAAKTASYTVLASDKCGTVFTNRGAAGAITITLPSPTLFPAGWFFHIVGVAGQNIIVATLTVDTLITFNDVAADSAATQTAGALIGAHALVFSDGTSWFYIGDTVGVTYTVAT